MRVFGAEFEEVFPLAGVAFLFGNLQNLAAGRACNSSARRTRKSSSVTIAGDARVLLHELLFARLDVDPPDVVVALVAIVEADEDFVRELLADFLNLGADAFDRREVFRFAGHDVGRVEVEILVAVFVLDVENVLVVVGPAVAGNGADFFFGDGLALSTNRRRARPRCSARRSTGAWKLIHFPSWLSRAWARLGLPNSTSRGMSGVSADVLALPFAGPEFLADGVCTEELQPLASRVIETMPVASATTTTNAVRFSIGNSVLCGVPAGCRRFFCSFAKFGSISGPQNRPNEGQDQLAGRQPR